jgi:muramoyltetrapeptide carboxypeptidase LdcA involved in peptidoglycan recycling
MNDYNKAIEVLKDWGFYVDNLWHIDSVKGDFTDAERMDILAQVMTDPEVDKFITAKIKMIVTKRSYEHPQD